MQLKHRQIDWSIDRDCVLERHCRINYECDCPWKRDEMTYEVYRAEWFGLSGQIEGFTNALLESMVDERTIAEIIESEQGECIAYLWAPYCADEESGFAFADVQDIYIEEQFRGAGIASQLMKYAEDKARLAGAKVIRSGTGCENTASQGMHAKMGYYQYRMEYEKLL